MSWCSKRRIGKIIKHQQSRTLWTYQGDNLPKGRCVILPPNPKMLSICIHLFYNILENVLNVFFIIAPLFAFDWACIIFKDPLYATIKQQLNYFWFLLKYTIVLHLNVFSSSSFSVVMVSYSSWRLSIHAEVLSWLKLNFCSFPWFLLCIFWLKLSLSPKEKYYQFNWMFKIWNIKSIKGFSPWFSGSFSVLVLFCFTISISLAIQSPQIYIKPM